MNQKVFHILEYHKVLDMLAQYATGEKIRERIRCLVPMENFSEILFSLQETDEATRLLLKYANPPYCGLAQQETSIKRAKNGGNLSPSELLQLAGILRISRSYKDYAEELEGYPILGGYIDSLLTFLPLEREVERCIVSEDEIADGASAELATIRRTIRNLNGKIRDTLNGLITSSTRSKFLQEPIITTRGGRYVVPVKAEHRSDVPGLVHDTSSTGATVFIEPMAVVEANNKLREEEAKEKHEIERILAELSQMIAQDGDQILENIQLIEKIDFAFSKGKLSLLMNGSLPEINQEGIVDLKKARHPLIAKDKVVAVDIKIGEDFDTLVITGPNTGGKTVSLKTAGLLVLMAQTGLHIPAADHSKIAVFREVFADIGDEQSIEQSLSTFSSHMTNIVGITEKAGPDCLVLFDELGAGTDPVEGAALAMAILEEVKQRGAKTIATTHYSELKLYAMTTSRVENASCEFDVETLKPTYRLVIGIPGKSNAFAISQKIGLDKRIIEKAQTLLSKENIQFEDVLNELEKNRQTAMKEKEHAAALERQAQELKTLMEKEKEKIEKEKGKMIERATLEAKEIIDKTTREMEQVLEEIKRLRREKKDQEALKALEEIRKDLKGKSHRMERRSQPKRAAVPGEIPKKLIPGTEVYIVDTDTNGTVISPPDKKGNVSVQTGILKIVVPVTSLRQIHQNEGEKIAKKYALSRSISNKANSIAPQIDLRGCYVQEALDKVDKFIDDAMVASLKNVTIVHGKGTGALKKAIQEMLKTHPYVKSFRSGRYGEGEDGVTIVELQ